jgi:hypothetical protein
LSTEEYIISLHIPTAKVVLISSESSYNLHYLKAYDRDRSPMEFYCKYFLSDADHIVEHQRLEQLKRTKPSIMIESGSRLVEKDALQVMQSEGMLFGDVDAQDISDLFR